MNGIILQKRKFGNGKIIEVDVCVNGVQLTPDWKGREAVAARQWRRKPVLATKFQATLKSGDLDGSLTGHGVPGTVLSWHSVREKIFNITGFLFFCLMSLWKNPGVRIPVLP